MMQVQTMIIKVIRRVASTSVYILDCLREFDNLVNKLNNKMLQKQKQITIFWN